MYYRIDVSGPVPIYEQIIQQVKAAIATGALLPDDPIPSVREVAKELAINPNTVARAYRDLQKEGTIYPNRGLGLNVSQEAPEKCRTERIESFQENVDRLLADALRNRFSPETIKRVIGEALKKLPTEVTVS